MTDGLSFTTFLKLTLMSSTQAKLGVLHRMLNSSEGYDFYKRMKFAAREVARGETTAEEILGKLASIKKDAERAHNILMAKRFLTWLKGLGEHTASPDRPSGTYKLPHMAFGVRLRPEFVYTANEEVYVTYLWATKLPRLTRQAAGAGLYMLKNELAKGQYASARFQIYDLRQERVFAEDTITNQSPDLLAADIALVNAIWLSALPKAA